MAPLTINLAPLGGSRSGYVVFFCFLEANISMPLSLQQIGVYEKAELSHEISQKMGSGTVTSVLVISDRWAPFFEMAYVNFKNLPFDVISKWIPLTGLASSFNSMSPWFWHQIKQTLHFYVNLPQWHSISWSCFNDIQSICMKTSKDVMPTLMFSSIPYHLLIPIIGVYPGWTTKKGWIHNDSNICKWTKNTF